MNEIQTFPTYFGVHIFIKMARKVDEVKMKYLVEDEGLVVFVGVILHLNHCLRTFQIDFCVTQNYSESEFENK